MKLTGKTSYVVKDQLKTDKATKFIGCGVEGSSTFQYDKDFGDLANCGIYQKEDIVFISSNGNRANRLKPDFEEIKKAIIENVQFIIDPLKDRKRFFNIGEREIAKFLLNNNFQ
jgi:hypothetical protein